MGYDARWGVFGAHHAGAPHKRDRIWIVAHSSSERGRLRHPSREDAENAGERSSDSGNDSRRVGPWDIEPNVGRVAHGVAARVHRLKAIGNGQVPAVAALAWKILTQ
jgi:DNA (cytosine-5)-methyltransferase 1